MNRKEIALILSIFMAIFSQDAHGDIAFIVGRVIGCFLIFNTIGYLYERFVKKEWVDWL
jgi:predicted Na+-dependent transporter